MSPVGVEAQSGGGAMIGMRDITRIGWGRWALAVLACTAASLAFGAPRAHAIYSFERAWTVVDPETNHPDGPYDLAINRKNGNVYTTLTSGWLMAFTADGDFIHS